MTPRDLVAGALAAAVLAPASARAEDAVAPEPGPRPDPAAPAVRPDPAAAEAGDANLESLAPRKGMIFTFALGGAFSIGLGMKNATGQGGAATVRLAHVASPRTVLAVEIVGSVLLFSVNGELYRTDASNFMLAAQYYVNPALWIRGAVGWGRYAGNELRMGDAIFRERFRLAGPAGSAGAGIDVIRFKRLRASIEFCSTALLNGEGVLSSNGFLVGLSID